VDGSARIYLRADVDYALAVASDNSPHRFTYIPSCQQFPAWGGVRRVQLCPGPSRYWDRRE